jgi:hypothetical protein
MMKVTFRHFLLVSAIGLCACAPEVGSAAWCSNMEDQPTGDWSMNEAAEYAKNCLIKMIDD